MTPNAEKQFAMQIMLVEIYWFANDFSRGTSHKLVFRIWRRYKEGLLSVD
jgi:hypothetical protein